MADDWDEAMLAAHSAHVSMGSFMEPLDPDTLGLTYGQWQAEMMSRMIIAATEAIRYDEKLLAKYGFREK